MDTDQVIRIALTVLTPVLTAGIGILALVVGDWRERRTQAGSRKLAFDDASRQVAFAADWWNASKLIADSPDAQQRAAAQAQGWLDEASALVTGSEPPTEHRQAITLRRLLLAYPLHRRAARILRAFYWLSLGMVAQNVSSALAGALGRADTLGIPNYFSGGKVYGDVISIAITMVFAMGFRFGALHVENSDAAAAARRLTLRRALLWYRMRRPAAMIARIVFYLFVAVSLLVAALAVAAVVEDPRLIPANLLAVAAFVGWTAGLWYWAVSLEARGAPHRGEDA